MNTSETKYGFCPKCGARGIARERRMDGNDKCINGHLYKSSAATHGVREEVVQRVVEMNAQRALELAREVARKLDPHFPAQELSDFEKALACQALYHYAEIVQAETAAYARGSDLDVLKTRMSEPWPSMIYVSSHRMKTDLVTTELIIKPKPLGQK